MNQKAKPIFENVFSGMSTSRRLIMMPKPISSSNGSLTEAMFKTFAIADGITTMRK